MDPTITESSGNDYGGRDNHSYAPTSSDPQLTTLNEQDDSDVKLPPRALSSSTLRGISEVPTNIKNTMTNGPPPSASSASFNQHQSRKSSALGPFDRQLSLLDPMSDRVSTILVWKNLTVEARPSKSTEFFKRMKSSKDFVPTRKSLLSNTSGAIAGGLWAVMGKYSVLV